MGSWTVGKVGWRRRTLCPGLIGDLGVSHGTGSGPHILPDHSEIFFAANDIYRYSYPALGAIESWTPTTTVSNVMGSMCMAGDGTIYYCEVQNGRIWQRTTPTSGGTDSLITWTLPDTSTDSNLGAGDLWWIAWNPATERIMAVRHANGFSPLVWSCDPSTQDAEVLPITLPSISSAFSLRAVCTGDGATWITVGGTLIRVNAAGDDYQTGTDAYGALAVTIDNRAIIQTGDAELSTVNSAMTVVPLACEEVYADADTGFIALNGGTQDPNGGDFAVFYVDGLNSLIWEWS